MASCVMCGSPLPSNQGSRICSMCYGDIDHGKDGYYRAELEREWERQNEEEAHRRQQEDEFERQQEGR